MAKRQNSWKDSYDPSTPLRNPRHEAVAQMAATANDWKAALKAGGYSTRSRVNYTRLVGKPYIRARIDWIAGQVTAAVIQETAKERAVDRDEVIRVYRSAIRDSEVPDQNGRLDLSARCKAAEGLGRSIGVFTDRKIVESEFPDFESMTPEQLEHALGAAAARMDPNELRSILGSAEARSGRADAVGERKSDSAVPPVSETSSVPSTRH